MKTATSVYAGIAVIATACAVSLWFEFRKERISGPVEQQQPSDSSRPISPASDPGALTRPAEAPINTTSSSSPAPPPVDKLSERLSKVTGLQKDLMSDPAYRKTILAHMRGDIERLYPSLKEALGLSDSEANDLFDLLANSQFARAEDGYILGGQVDPQEARDKSKEFDQLQEQAIQAKLGAKYAQWQAYRQTVPARTQVAGFVTQLAQAGRPLTTAQKEALTTAIITERQLQDQEATSLPQTLPGNPNDPTYRAQEMEELSNREEAGNRRILDAAARYIDADQLEILRSQIERQTSLIRETRRTRLAREIQQPQLPQ